jgi:hypothetical protein
MQTFLGQHRQFVNAKSKTLWMRGQLTCTRSSVLDFRSDLVAQTMQRNSGRPADRRSVGVAVLVEAGVSAAKSFLTLLIPQTTTPATTTQREGDTTAPFEKISKDFLFKLESGHYNLTKLAKVKLVSIRLFLRNV